MSDVSSLAQNITWVNDKNLNAKFTEAYTLPYTPYAQKVLVNNSDTIALRGDMHGDIHSLLCFLRDLKNKGFTSATNGFKIIDPKLKIIFLEIMLIVVFMVSK